MEMLLNDLNFLEYLDEVMKDNYKSERYVRFVKEFHDEWKARGAIFIDDGFFRLWGTELTVDDNMEIMSLLSDPLFSKIKVFFEMKNIKYINEITEEDLVELLYYETIGKVKYLMFMKLLFADLSASKENTSLTIETFENSETHDSSESDLIDIENSLGDEFLDKSVNSIYDSLEDIKGHIETQNKNMSKKIDFEKEKNINLSNKLINMESELHTIKNDFESERTRNKEQIRSLLTDLSDTYEKKKGVEAEIVQIKQKNDYLHNEIKKKIDELNKKENTIIYLQNELEIKNSEIIELQNTENRYVNEIHSTKIIYENEITLLKNEIDAYKKTITEFSSLRGMVEHILDKFRKNTQTND